MRCPFCGKEINDSHPICENCGFDMADFPYDPHRFEKPVRGFKTLKNVCMVISFIVPIIYLGMHFFIPELGLRTVNGVPQKDWFTIISTAITFFLLFVLFALFSHLMNKKFMMWHRIYCEPDMHKRMEIISSLNIYEEEENAEEMAQAHTFAQFSRAYRKKHKIFK